MNTDKKKQKDILTELLKLDGVIIIKGHENFVKALSLFFPGAEKENITAAYVSAHYIGNFRVFFSDNPQFKRIDCIDLSTA